MFILVHTGLQAWVESLSKAAAHIGDPTACKSAAAEGLGQRLGCVWDLFGVTKRGCVSWHLSQDLSFLTCNMVSPTGLILAKRQGLL